METTIIFNGWTEGFRKISFTKLVMKHTRLELKESKEITDDILNNKERKIIFTNKITTNHFLVEAKKLGAKGTLSK